MNPGITVVARNPITGREDDLKGVIATATTIEKAAAAVVINQAAVIKVDKAIMKAGNVIVATVEAKAKATM